MTHPFAIDTYRKRAETLQGPRRRASTEPDVQRGATVHAQAAQGPGRTLSWLRWSVAGLTVAAAPIVWCLQELGSPNLGVIRLLLAPAVRAAYAAIAPDDRRVVWMRRDINNTRLWVQALDAQPATVLEGTEDARSPFWSPDGQNIGFFAGGTLKRIAVSGGPPVTNRSQLTPVPIQEPTALARRHRH